MAKKDGGGKQYGRTGYRSLPNLRTPTVIPQGPRLYKTPRDKGYISEFMRPAPGFVTGQTSTYEWMVYLAFQKLFNLPSNPYLPPFEGGMPIWGFQVGSSQLGSSKRDFVVYPNRRTNGVQYTFRIQTEYFHNFTDSDKQAYDIMQAVNLSDYSTVVDIYDYEFADDPTGQSIIILLKRAMNGELWSPPSVTGFALRVRPGRRQG